MSSTSQDAVFAILESAASRADKSSVEAKLRVLVRMAVEDALGIGVTWPGPRSMYFGFFKLKIRSCSKQALHAQTKM